MFYSRQIYTFLVESISNYTFKEEKKITQIATRHKQSPTGYSTKQLFFPRCQKLRKKATKKFLFQENKNTLTGPENFFDDFEVKYLQIANISEKQVSFKLKVIFSTKFRPKTKKIARAVFEKNIKVSDFGLIWRPFREYLQIKNFFSKIRLCDFSTFIVL